jgi:hypothetical protein
MRIEAAYDVASFESMLGLTRPDFESAFPLPEPEDTSDPAEDPASIDPSNPME